MQFQSLEGIFGFFNNIEPLGVSQPILFQSLEGIFGFFNSEPRSAKDWRSYCMGFNP
ncbi:hypothetical protein CKA32_000691 [Geitlerinema sp. FC II]|nr:hypothetical protein CKA32_000691 [Geitlerinema sp. FC II]